MTSTEYTFDTPIAFNAIILIKADTARTCHDRNLACLCAALPCRMKSDCKRLDECALQSCSHYPAA